MAPFSTHITSDLGRVADRVAILKDGQIVYSEELDVAEGQREAAASSGRPSLAEWSYRVPGMLHVKVTGHEAVVSVQDFTARFARTHCPAVVGRRVRCRT